MYFKFLHISTSCSKFLQDSPEFENTRSLGTDDAGIVNTSTATFGKIGNWFSFPQNSQLSWLIHLKLKLKLKTNRIQSGRKRKKGPLGQEEFDYYLSSVQALPENSDPISCWVLVILIQTLS